MEKIFYSINEACEVTGLPEPVDGVVTINKSTETTAADQAALNGLTSLVVATQGSAASPALYAAAGNAVTVPCPVKVTAGGTTCIGKAGTGTLIFSNDISFDPRNKELGLCGDVRLNGGSSLGANGAISTLGTGDNADSTVVTFGCVFMKAAVTTCQTRGKTTFRFAADNVFGTEGTPLFVLGRTSKSISRSCGRRSGTEAGARSTTWNRMSTMHQTCPNI